MPRNTQGTYTLPDGSLVTSGDTILPSQHNPPLQDISQALTNSLARSGVGGMLGDLNMAGKDIKAAGVLEVGTVSASGDLTGQNLNITSGNQVRFGSFTFYAQIVGNRPSIFFDKSNDHFIDYNPALDEYRFWLHGVVVASLNAAGNLILRGSLTQNGNPT